MTQDISHFLAQLERTVTGDKVERGGILDEGGKWMTFEVHSKMCEIVYNDEDEEYLLGNAFLSMDLDLMARSDNFVHMSINYVQFKMMHLYSILVNLEEIPLD